MTTLEKVRTAVLRDLRELSKLQVYSKPVIRQVENGKFDNDIIEFHEGGLSISEISNFILQSSY